MNCIALMAPKKNTVGITSAWIASQRNVKMGYATGVRAAAAAGLGAAVRATAEPLASKALAEAAA